jgi:hypothetical protein
MKSFPSLLNSGVVIETPLFGEIASGAGIAANIPFYKDISDDTNPLEAGLGWVTKLDKGDFIGREPLLEVKLLTRE